MGDARVQVVDDSGLHVGSVDASEVDNLPAGVRVESPEQAAQRQRQAEYGGLAGQALAAGEGALSAATLGGSTLALDALGYGGDVAALREVNPTSSMLGQVGGSLMGLGKFKGAAGAATSVVAGPTKLLYRAGGALERGLGGGLLGTGVRAAMEGAAFGLGDAISESAIYDTELTGEMLAASMGQGMLYGGGAAVGAAGLGKGLSLAARGLKATGKALSGPASAGYAKVVSAMTGVDEGKVARLLSLTPEGKAARAVVMGGDDAVARHVDDLAKSIDDVGRHEDDVFRVVREQDLKKESIAKMMPSGGDEQAILFASQKMDDAFGTIDDLINNKALHSGHAENKRLRDAMTLIRKETAEGVESAVDSALKKAELASGLDRMKREIGKYAKSADGRALRKNTVQNLATADKFKSLYERMRTSLEDTKIWGKFGDAQRRVNAPLTEMLGVNNAYQQGFTAKFGRSTSDPWRAARVADRGKITAYLNDLKSPKNDLRHRAITERMSSMESAADAVAEMYGVDPAKLKAAAGRTRQTVAEAGETASVRNAMAELETASGGGIAGGLVGGSIASGNLAGIALAPLLNPARTVRQLAAVEALAGRVNGRLRDGVKGLFKGIQRQAVLATPRLEQARDGFEQRAKTVRQLAERGDLEDELTRSMGELAYGAPEAQRGAKAATMRGVDHLMRHMPLAEPNGYGIAPESMMDPWEVAQWIDRANAIADPAAIFDPLSNDGPISLAGVDAIRDVYPAVFRDTRQQIEAMALERAAMGELLPNATREQLGIAFDLPQLEPTMTPDVLRAVGEAYAIQPEPPPGKRGGAGSDLNLANAMATTSDRIERGNTR